MLVTTARIQYRKILIDIFCILHIVPIYDPTTEYIHHSRRCSQIRVTDDAIFSLLPSTQVLCTESLSGRHFLLSWSVVTEEPWIINKK